MLTKRTTFISGTALATLALVGCAQNPPVTAPAAPLAVQGKSVPGDAAIPIAELMPLTMRYEADLKLTPEQTKALAEYRNVNMPQRIAGQKQLLTLRGNLRAAMLEGKPTADLMRQVQQTELAHMQARERCVEFMRKTLAPAQYTHLTRLYLDGLR